MIQISDSEWAKIQRERIVYARLVNRPAAIDPRLKDLAAKYRERNGKMVILETHELVSLLLAEYEWLKALMQEFRVNQ